MPITDGVVSADRCSPTMGDEMGGGNHGQACWDPDQPSRPIRVIGRGWGVVGRGEPTPFGCLTTTVDEAQEAT